MGFEPIPENVERVVSLVLDCAFRVHTALGPGLLESAYEACLCHELRKQGLIVIDQRLLPVEYDGVLIDAGYRIDLLVEECVIVELKAVSELTPVHEAQVLTYLKLSKVRVGLLLNFNTKHLKEGIKRIVL